MSSYSFDDLYSCIVKRKSFHLFHGLGNKKIQEDEMNEIREMLDHLNPLNPNIKTGYRIVKGSSTTCHRKEEYCILFYSEEKENYLQNIGYIGEQADLYLTSMNIATLWVGMAKPDRLECDGLSYVIMLAIHKAEDASVFRKDMFKSKRKPISEIWQGQAIYGVSEIVRFAPSACNSQPWYVENENDRLKIYRKLKDGKIGLMKRDTAKYFNRIDMGIFLCFLELCLNHEGYGYSVKLFEDTGTDESLTLNAEYSVHQKRIL